MAATYTIEQYARKALKNDPDAASPSDADLAMDVLIVESEMQAKFPCTAAIPVSGTDADQEAYNRWIGNLVAIEFLGTPAGQEVIGATGSIIETTLGPVKEKTTGPSAADIKTQAEKTAVRARSLISCIRTRFAGNDTAGVMTPDLTGRRRTLGNAGTVEGDLLGLGDGVVRRTVP